MRRVWLLSIPLAYAILAACVGSDATPGGGAATGDGGGGSSGSNPNTNGDGSATNPGNGGGDGGDAGPGCGYPGEACCAAPTQPCRIGTICGTAEQKCMVNRLVAVGELLEVQEPGPVFTTRLPALVYSGQSWAAVADLFTEPGFSGTFHPYDLIAPGEDSYFAVIEKSNQGKMFNYSSSAWRRCELGQTCAGPLGVPQPEMWTVARVGTEIWVGGTNKIYRCAQNPCTEQIAGLESTTWATGKMVGTSPQDIWFAAFGRAFHYDGTAWTIHESLDVTGAIYQLKKDDVWVGGRHFQHWNGTAWSDPVGIDGAPAPGTVDSISGASSRDLWAVGSDGSQADHPTFAAHWDGVAWTRKTLPAGTKGNAVVYAPSSIEAFLAAETGIYRWDGTEWKAMTLPTYDAGLGGGQPVWTHIAGPAQPRP